MMKVALLAGATGLVGKHVLSLLLADPEYHKVKVLSRKAIGTVDPKLENIIINFDDLDSVAEQLKADDVFCCLGTTMKKAGSKEAFKKVDFTYPLHLARLSKLHGAKQYLLISALGAEKTSSIYYNHVKGEVEEAIAGLGFDSYHILRPSLLLGHREENRSGEDAAKSFYTIFGCLIPEKYKAIDSAKVARAMISLARKEEDGQHIHESIALQKL